MPKKSRLTPKIAIVHAFFKADCKGGGEKLILQMREHYGADLMVGGYDQKSWGKDNTDDYYAQKTHDERFKFDYLHKDSKIPIWKQLKRQLFFLFSPKINRLLNYDFVIFSGNIGFFPRRLKKKIQQREKYLNNQPESQLKVPKLVTYVHTPPRPFTDQFTKRLAKLPVFLRPLAKLLKKYVITNYQKDSEVMDLIIANSKNIKARLKKYCNVKADEVIFPIVQTKQFTYQSTQDYFLSYGRLENLKRIPLILEAFKDLPNQKLIIASGGPLKNYVQNFIKTHNLKNVSYEGIVSDERLRELVGNCRAGVYIPENEDAGMTQVEFISAGKPVIGVKEGGLIETLIDQKTAFLIPANPSKEDLIKAIEKMTPKKAKSMKKACLEQSKKFGHKIFFGKLDQAFLEFLDNKKYL